MKRSFSFAIALLIFCLLKEAKGDDDPDSDSDSDTDTDANANADADADADADSDSNFNSSSDYDQDELSLFQDLFYNRKYDKRIRPVKNKSDPVNVILNVAYIQLIDLDDRSQTLKSSVWIRQSWKNEFLDWNPDDYGGITEITVDKGFLWVPDLVLYNTADDSGGNMDQFKTRVAINASGWHKWYAPAILKSGCKVDISYFPFDYQTCTLKFGSWTFLGPQLNLTSELKTADLNFFLKSSQFDLLSANAVRNVIIYTCCVEPYIDITFHLTLKRQPGFYVFNLIVPSIVITFFALTVFAFPPQCGERMGLAFDCFLNISIISMMVSTMMPRDSETTPLLATFMTMCMVEMTLSAAMNAFCYRIERQTPMPNWVRHVVIQTIAPVLGIEPCGTGITCPKFRCYGGVFEMSVRLRKRKDEENAFPGEHKALTDRRPSVDFSQSSGYPRTSISEPECFSDFLFNSTSINPVLDEGCISKLDKEALLGLNTLVRRELRRMEEECTRDFWRCVSQILDRCLLLTFIFAWIFIVTLLFLSVPSNSTLE